MARSPLANLSPEEFAVRRRMLMGVLAVIGILVVVLVIAQVRAAIVVLPGSVGAVLPNASGFEQDVRALEQEISNIGAQAGAVSDAGETALLNAVFQEVLFQELAEAVDAQSEETLADPPDEALQERGTEPEPEPEPEPEVPVDVPTSEQDTLDALPQEELEGATGGDNWQFDETEPVEEEATL